MLALVAILGTLLVLNLVGWSVTLFLMTRNQLREATALETLGKLQRYVDDQVGKVADQVRNLMAPRKSNVDEPREQTILDDTEEARREYLRQRLERVTGGDMDSGPYGPLPEMPVAE